MEELHGMHICALMRDVDFDLKSTSESSAQVPIFFLKAPARSAGEGAI